MALEFLAITLRFLHIGAAMAWVGSAVFLAAVLDPMAKRIPRDEADRFMRHLQLRSSLGKYFPSVAGVTVVAGLALYAYLKLQDPSPLETLGTLPNIVFHVGVVTGLAAFVFSMVAEGRTSKRLQALSAALEANRPAAEAGEFARLSARLARATRVSVALMAIALVGMGTFRYWDL